MTSEFIIYLQNSHYFKPIENGIISAIKKLPSNKESISNTCFSNNATCKLIDLFVCKFVRKQVSKWKLPKSVEFLKYFAIPAKTIINFANFAKLFESIFYSQLNDYIENKFSKYLSSFRKNHNTQNSFLRMIESWKSKLNRR